MSFIKTHLFSSFKLEKGLGVVSGVELRGGYSAWLFYAGAGIGGVGGGERPIKGRDNLVLETLAQFPILKYFIILYSC